MRWLLVWQAPVAVRELLLRGHCCSKHGTQQGRPWGTQQGSGLAGSRFSLTWPSCVDLPFLHYIDPRLARYSLDNITETHGDPVYMEYCIYGSEMLV